MDLDQAMHLERRGAGFRVRYAIADVAAFVRPGGAIDAEAHRRVETLYSPDTRTPLHPPSLSEGAASLLPGQVRPAVLWTIDLDADGEQTGVDVRRALVRSRDQLDYAGVQDLVDAGTADERLQLLRRGRQAADGARGRARRRQPADPGAGGRRGRRDASGWSTGCRCPVESWNEQISLLTGMAAAGLMLHGEVGVLRTLPNAPDGALRPAAPGRPGARRRLAGRQVVRRGGARPRPGEPAARRAARGGDALLRGAGYTAFDGGVPEHATHAAVAAPYAHATAPLRRLVDRYVGEVCLALCAGTEVPGWVRAALPRLPAEMAAGDRGRTSSSGACVALIEAAVLHGRVGQDFDAVVVELDSKHGGGTVQLADPAVRAACERRPAARRGRAGAPRRGRRGPSVRCGSPWPEDRYAGRTADEPAGRPRRGPHGCSPRKVRAPQGKVVGNTHPG